jgi:alpha-L-rhamnosidase
MRRFCLFLFLLLSDPAWAQSAADGWITHPSAAGVRGPVVLHFRRALVLADAPKVLPVTVTADNRFILFVNGRRVASGPSTGTIAHWRTEQVDLAPYLHPGANMIAAVVWDFVRQSPSARQGGALPAAGALPPQVAPIAQQSVALGFRLTGGGIATSEPGWRVKLDAGHTAVNGRAQVPRGRYYVASAPEVIDAAKADWDWAGPEEKGEGWQNAVPAPEAASRHLVEDKLPQQSFVTAPAGQVVRSDLEGAKAFLDRPLIVPANTHAHILIRRDTMISAYPELEVSGGQGASIKLTYTEALYDAENKKADRDLVDDRRALGIFDTFMPDGARRRFMPLWWRTWRYAELDVQTGNAPLTLEAFHVYETGYPFKQVAHFTSSDPELNRIWDVGWRTAQVDAHETYMDSAYWEQLQYTGDTRLQMLISYAVSGDPRLAEQAIDAFAESDAEGGLEQGAYPSRSDNVIATFSLAWVGMLSDWSMQQPDDAVIRRHLPRMRTILKWFARPGCGPMGSSARTRNGISSTGSKAAMTANSFPPMERMAAPV